MNATAEYREMIKSALNSAVDNANRFNANEMKNTIEVGDIVCAKGSKIERRVVKVETEIVVADRLDQYLGQTPNSRSWLNRDRVVIVKKGALA